jgi:hypothetical protein
MAAVDYAFPAIDATTAASLANAGGLSGSFQNTLINNIKKADTDNFLLGLNAADGASNNMLTYGVMLSRNKTIGDIATDLTQKNLKTANGSKDTYIRQGEINEWQAQNKLDTLFFLQTLFLFFTLMVVLMFLRRYGIVTTGMLYMIGGLFTLILVGILWNRASYTFNSRDPRYWNRRYIGLKDSGLSAKSATCQ